MEYSAKMNDHALTARSAAASGMVLLKNTGNTLPLLPTDAGVGLPVAVFGVGQIRTALYEEGLTPWRSIGVLDGLQDSDLLCPDPLLARKYRTFALEHPEGGELPLNQIPFAELAEANEAAVVVLSRPAEAYDIHMTADETALLQAVTKAFSRTVLVIAAPGYVLLDDAAASCGAIVFMGLAGQEGGYALADLLTAQVIPSGHLAFTWPLSDADCKAASAVTDHFAGYRYYDAFGCDVRFPFGYGLGYGTAVLGAVSVGLDGCDVTVSAELQNISETYPALETVQVYASHPAEDRTQPVSILICFDRCRLLSPGESQTVQLRFPVTELSVYRPAASAYVLEAGTYEIRVGTNSRATYLAGAIRLTRSAVVQATEHLSMEGAAERTADPDKRYTYPGEDEERKAAHAHAIRLSDRNLPRRSRRRGSSFRGCNSDGNLHTMQEVREGKTNVFYLVASMDDVSLQQFVQQFAACPSGIAGDCAESCPMEPWQIPAAVLAKGSQWPHLEQEILDEEGNVLRRQYVTAFPAASLLACAFDPETVTAVARSMGEELQEFGIHLFMGPGANVQLRPDAVFHRLWSEDPVLSGICASVFAEGLKPYAAAVLHAEGLPETVSVSSEAFHDLYGLGFEIAAGAYQAAMLPCSTVSGQDMVQGSPLVRGLVLDCGYRGMLFGGKPAELSRLELEKAAIRILKLMVARDIR